MSRAFELYCLNCNRNLISCSVKSNYSDRNNRNLNWGATAAHVSIISLIMPPILNVLNRIIIFML